MHIPCLEASSHPLQWFCELEDQALLIGTFSAGTKIKNELILVILPHINELTSRFFLETKHILTKVIKLTKDRNNVAKFGKQNVVHCVCLADVFAFLWTFFNFTD